MLNNVFKHHSESDLVLKRTQDCKGVTVNVLFLRDYSFALGSPKTYSQDVKFALSRCSLIIFCTANQHHAITHLQATGQHKNRADLK